MDFMQRLNERINSIDQLPIESKMGYLGADESLVLYPLPGSQIVTQYMDGTTDQQLNYEIAMKSKVQSKIHQSLWAIQTELENLTELESQDNSFEFEELIITNKPFINNADEQGWFVFLLDVQANITVFKEEE
ncbi:minor capsid protein [Virgibacillus salarius]|uniref:minor capsid protein n=1 Tax=Virgibacillus salarius TaxID=447199 RepID=UPI002492FFF8|nr:minor capsid protein [Virgibacillus salarius]WBX81291.1 minor capsid protein [Virgibacillus salarius]